MTRTITFGFLLCLACQPAMAQSSVDVNAGNLHANAQAGASGTPQRDAQVARGPRTDDTRNCDSHGVTVRNGNSSASASVTTSPGGASAVAGGGSPGSQTEYFGCHSDHTERSTR